MFFIYINNFFFLCLRVLKEAVRLCGGVDGRERSGLLRNKVRIRNECCMFVFIFSSFVCCVEVTIFLLVLSA